jgi:hypothetical protein
VGRKRKATPEIEQFIGETVRARPDMTLAELQVKLRDLESFGAAESAV